MVEKPDRQQEWQERVAHWRASGLSQSAFALEHGFSQKQIRYWSRRFAGPQPFREFVPARVALGGSASAIGRRSAHGWTLTFPRDVPASLLAGRDDAGAVMDVSAQSIWLATGAVDIRTGIDGLSLHVPQALGCPPCDGTAFVFANRRRMRLKLVC